jgi:hypothetical protein
VRDSVGGVTTWKFLHILCMFAATSIFVGQGAMAAAIESSGDVRAIRRAARVETSMSPIGGTLFLLGIGFGVATAIGGDIDLTEGWLLTAYGLVAAILLTGILYHAPRGKRLEALADASPEDEPSAELRAFLAEPSVRVTAVVDLALWIGVIYTMVAKPFS